jgi:hypothetical protein
MASLLAGFEPDPGTGLLYSSFLGLWFDQSRALFMDASTGVWCVHMGWALGCQPGASCLVCCA